MGFFCHQQQVAALKLSSCPCFHGFPCQLSHSATSSFFHLSKPHVHSFISFLFPLSLLFSLLRYFHIFSSYFLPCCSYFPFFHIADSLSSSSFSLSLPSFPTILLFSYTFFSSLLLPQCAWSLSRESAGALIAAPLPDIHRRWHLWSTEPQPSFCIFPLSEHIRKVVTSRKLEAFTEAGSHGDHWSQHETLERLVNVASTTGSSNAFCTVGLRLRAFTGTDISKVAQQCYTRVFKQNECLCSTPLQLRGSLWEGDFPVIEQRWFFIA